MTATDKSAAAYRTISEVAEDLGVPQHVLRFWETRFPALKPLKRGGNRRYYRPADIALLRAINRLLYTDGYTIKGVLKLIAEKGVGGLDPVAATDAATTAAPLAVAAAAPVIAPDNATSAAPQLPLPPAAAPPAVSVTALYAIRDRLAGALAEARAA